MNREQVRVEAQGIRLSYGETPVLRDVSVTVEPGEFFALLGPSGSGKSTLLRLIAGFAQAQAGRIVIAGRDVTTVPPWERDVGLVFQSYALWPHMNVERNVAFGLEERRLPRDEVKRRALAALELVGLAGFEKRRPSQLSGGQQQRVALARTLAIEPKVLLLDEPLSNLDARLRVQMRRELRAMQERLGITTIFVTHDQEEALTMCDRIAVLDQGVVQQVGSPRELFDQPANRFVAQFVGSVNLVDSREDRGQVAFRPHAVTFEDVPPDFRGLRLDGRIESAEFVGEYVRYEVRVGRDLVIADEPHRRGASARSTGSTVHLAVPEDEIRTVDS